MPIQQTIDIPAHPKGEALRLTIDVPREVPTGPVILTFTPAPETPPAQDLPPLEPWLVGIVNPALRGTVKTVGDIIGPFHDVWEKGY
ncbi:hypothetical protein FACS1894137_19120 [Spirochaetia bacterium]|nr:hypothetical protein FACS1894137_19120 [Spirochaetia bacterium]